MSEETRHPGTELNDASLEGISGGIGEDLIRKATRICKDCQHKKTRTCNVTVEEFARYIQNHGAVSTWYYCPLQPGLNR